MIANKLLQNTDTVIGKDELLGNLHDGRKLKIKFGVDPTRPDLTFGHLVVFNKLRQFQDAGHETILLIGDYTARIGDPSGRSEIRPELSEEEVAQNASTYLEQAFKILDESKTVVRRNSEWFGKMNFGDALSLTRSMTVARMLERDDFEKRFKSNQPISMVEFMYPLIQGYDSIVLRADVEIGGSDQLFNMLVGRNLQKEKGLSQQAVITLPLLVGLDGSKKMSKSYDNYIAFNDSAKNIFGKIMSISDEVMWDYFKLLLLKTDKEILDLRELHPMECKKQLANELTAVFYGKDVGVHELNSFSQVFSQGQDPENMPEISISKNSKECSSLLNLLAASGEFESKGQIRRLFKQGAIKLNGEKVEDPDIDTSSLSRDSSILKAGKKIFLRIIP
jgi:tyrosyl-tRNA synthetase